MYHPGLFILADLNPRSHQCWPEKTEGTEQSGGSTRSRFVAEARSICFQPVSLNCSQSGHSLMGLHLMDKIQDSCSQIQAVFSVFLLFLLLCLVILFFMLFKICSVLMPKYFGVFQDKSGCKIMVHQRDTEEKCSYLTQVVKIGHLIEICLGWLSWVSYIKELICLVIN